MVDFVDDMPVTVVTVNTRLTEFDPDWKGTYAEVMTKVEKAEPHWTSVVLTVVNPRSRR